MCQQHRSARSAEVCARAGERGYPLLRGVGLFWECFLVRNASAAQVAAGEPYEYNDLKDCDNELCAPSGNRHCCHRCNPQFKLCLDEVESLFSRTSSGRAHLELS